MSAAAAGSTPRSAAWFVLVGCLAAAVHWAVVVGLVEGQAWPALLANVAGWLVALSVSFAGHHSLSFRGHGVPAHRSAVRFVAVSAAGFSINETAYALLLRWSGRRYDLLLALVLVCVALLTWWLSRHWVFRRKP
mgnify:CR=1 FL=1